MHPSSPKKFTQINSQIVCGEKKREERRVRKRTKRERILASVAHLSVQLLGFLNRASEIQLGPQ